MPAVDPRQTTLRGAHRASIFWACVWYVITLGGWLASWSMERLGQSDAAGLTVLVVAAELVSAALRWNSLSRADAWQSVGNNKSATEMKWLCAWGAQANALGIAAMLSPNWTAVLPGLMVTVVLEALMLSKACRVSRPIGQSVAPEAVLEITPLTTESAATDVIHPLSITLDDQQWTRSTHEGHSDSGERFLSGWVQFELAADQKLFTLTVGFSPAFQTVPDVELDQEVDAEESHCEAVIEHVTPAGMRVAIKRTTTGAPLSGKLLWHASESASPGTYPSLVRSQLP